MISRVLWLYLVLREVTFSRFFMICLKNDKYSTLATAYLYLS